MSSLSLFSKALFLGSFAAMSLGAAPNSGAPRPPALDPAATALWQQHIEGMGGRGEGGAAISNERVLGKALEFFETYPDERRVSGILYNLASFADWIKGPDRVRLRREWRLYLDKALADALETRSWPDRIWAGLQWVAAKNAFALQADESGAERALDAFLARVDTVAERAPRAPHRIFLEQEYLALLEKYRPAGLRGRLETLGRSEVPELAATGRGQLAILELKTRPLELRFTALDGSEVDLAQLRGKVVLIDCWATWCVPCVKELPFVKAALAKWGPRGFAVVGVSFDRPKDREKLRKFVENEKLAWPQWYDENGAVKAFGNKYDIRSIPATFLLGKDGRLVTTDTRGEKLDQALARLLED